MNAAFAHIDSMPNLVLSLSQRIMLLFLIIIVLVFQPPPLWIRNAPTQLMKDLNYGRDYVYTPSAEDEQTALKQSYLPVTQTLLFVFAVSLRDKTRMKCGTLFFWT
jgi:hypothetical protein